MTERAIRRVGMLAAPDAMKRYLAENPDRARVLVQLGHDTTLAVDNAAAAAIRACAALSA